MINLKSLLLPFLALSPAFLIPGSPLLARDGGVNVGGGGNAVVCFKDPATAKKLKDWFNSEASQKNAIPKSYLDQIETIELIDLVEAKMPKGFQKDAPPPALIEPDPNESAEKYAKRLLGRIKEFTPKLYDEIIESMNSMPMAEAIGNGLGFPQIDDVNAIGFLENDSCVVITISKYQVMGPKTLIVYNLPLINHPKHSAWSVKLTYLHEVLYRTLRTEYGDYSATSTRLIIGALLNKNTSIESFRRLITGILSPEQLKQFRPATDYEYYDSGVNFITYPHLSDFIAPINKLDQTLFCNGYNAIGILKIKQIYDQIDDRFKNKFIKLLDVSYSRDSSCSTLMLSKVKDFSEYEFLVTDQINALKQKIVDLYSPKLKKMTCNTYDQCQSRSEQIQNMRYKLKKRQKLDPTIDADDEVLKQMYSQIRQEQVPILRVGAQQVLGEWNRIIGLISEMLLKQVKEVGYGPKGDFYPLTEEKVRTFGESLRAQAISRIEKKNKDGLSDIMSIEANEAGAILRFKYLYISIEPSHENLVTNVDSEAIHKPLPIVEESLKSK